MSHADASPREHRYRLHLPHPHLPHGLITFPRRLSPWIEPWFLAYACLGIVQGGMLPLLLPLSAGGATHAGTIVGVMNLAGLTAPFWGHLADRRRLHRQVLLAGMLASLMALVLMPVPLGLPLKSVLAGILGLGFAAANTVANMFIVEVRPPEEWDARIGALQALSGTGQVAGLLLAGFIGGRYALAFGVAAALIAAAVPTAWLTLRGVQVPVPVPRAAATAHPPLGGEGWASAPQRLFHLLTWHGLVTVLRELEMPFARILGVWFVAFVAISAVLTMFPLALIDAFGVSAEVARHSVCVRRRRQPGDVSAGREHRETAWRAAGAASGICGAYRGDRDTGGRVPVAVWRRADGIGRICRSGDGVAVAGRQRHRTRRAPRAGGEGRGAGVVQRIVVIGRCGGRVPGWLGDAGGGLWGGLHGGFCCSGGGGVGLGRGSLGRLNSGEACPGFKPMPNQSLSTSSRRTPRPALRLARAVWIRRRKRGSVSSR